MKNWADIKKLVDGMTPEQLEQPVLIQDGNTGEFCELRSVHEKDGFDPDFPPPSDFVLSFE